MECFTFYSLCAPDPKWLSENKKEREDERYPLATPYSRLDSWFSIKPQENKRISLGVSTVLSQC